MGERSLWIVDFGERFVGDLLSNLFGYRTKQTEGLNPWFHSFVSPTPFRIHSQRYEVSIPLLGCRCGPRHNCSRPVHNQHTVCAFFSSSPHLNDFIHHTRLSLPLFIQCVRGPMLAGLAHLDRGNRYVAFTALFPYLCLLTADFSQRSALLSGWFPRLVRLASRP